MLSKNRPLASDFTIVLGLIVISCMVLAVVLGNWIAEENWFLLGITLCIAIGASLTLSLRSNWWILVPCMSVLGFSTLAPGFTLTGVDAAALLGFAIIAFRRAIGDLKPVQPSLRLNGVLFALLVYVFVHSVIAILYQYYAGETQLKNVIKAYCQIAAPLLLLWFLALYAKPPSAKAAVWGVLLISIPTFIVGCALVYLETEVPLLSHPLLSFDWAGAGALGYIRWSSAALLLFGLCLSTATRSVFLKTACLSVALLALIGAFLGGGRVAFASGVLGIACWMGLRRHLLLLALTGAAALLMLITVNADPRLLDDLPKTVQRSITPFILSGQRTSEQSGTELSDKWHGDLRAESWAYWMESPFSIAVGHGYKGWNDSIDIKTFTEGPLYESAKKTAIQMGRTERTFSSILVILGCAGVILYYGFMLLLVFRLWELRRLSPNGSFSKAMCEFSLCVLCVSLVTAFHAGGVPSYGMIYWFLGLLAARDFAPDTQADGILRNATPAVAQPETRSGIPGNAASL